LAGLIVGESNRYHAARRVGVFLHGEGCNLERLSAYAVAVVSAGNVSNFHISGSGSGRRVAGRLYQ
jgi:hypothetical protein